MKQHETLQVLAAFAERHHGVVSEREAAAAGIPAAAVRHWAKRGWLVRVAAGVFRVAGSVPTWHQTLLAEVWTAGDGAVAARGSAARLWGLPGFTAPVIEVLRASHCRRASSTVLETSFLPAAHVTALDGIPVTSVERTLFDVCGYYAERQARAAVADALGLGFTTPDRLLMTLAQTAARGRPGSAAMRRVLHALLAVDAGARAPESSARSETVGRRRVAA